VNEETSIQEFQSAYSEPEDLWARDNYFHEDVERHPAVRELRSVLGPAIVTVVRFRDETTIHVKPEYFRELCDFLRTHDKLAFVALTDVTAVDMLKLRTTPRFDVVALLYSIKNRVRLRIKAGIDDGQPVPSLVPLWPGVNWLEREVFDMFGIVFEGHPNLKRILLADDWDEGFPLRKDYPLRGVGEREDYKIVTREGA
jgi:NADH-quinone oxidoreductase subunit C